MKKTYYKLIPILLLMLSLMAGMICKAPVLAAGSSQLLDDGADLLTDKEEKDLLSQLTKLSDKRDCDLAVITAGNLEGKDVQAYVDDRIDSEGIGEDRSHGTVTLLIFVEQDDPSNREVAIGTDQKANTFFSDDDNNRVIDEMVPDLSSGSYGKACRTFGDTCDAVFGESLDEKNSTRGVSPGWIFGDLGIGAVIALIMGTFQKSKLKTRRRKSGAAEYKADGGIHFTVNNDTFLDRHIERRRIDRDQPHGESTHEAGTTHTTSSGSKHGGASRKF